TLHLARDRRSGPSDHALHRGARHRLHGRVGLLEQRAQLLGKYRRREARLQADAEQRGVRAGDPEAAEPARSDRTTIPGRTVRHDRLHADGCAAESKGMTSATRADCIATALAWFDSGAFLRELDR